MVIFSGWKEALPKNLGINPEISIINVIGTLLCERYLLKISIFFDYLNFLKTVNFVSISLISYEYEFMMRSMVPSLEASCATIPFMWIPFSFELAFSGNICLMIAKMSIEKSYEISAPHKTILMFISTFFRTWSMQVSSSIKLMLSVNSSNEATMVKNVMFYCTRSFCVYRHHSLRN